MKEPLTLQLPTGDFFMGLTWRSILVTKGRLWVDLCFDFDRLIYTTISLLCVSLLIMMLKYACPIMHRHKILRGFSLKVHFEDTVYIFFLHALETSSRWILPSYSCIWTLAEYDYFMAIQGRRNLSHRSGMAVNVSQ